MNKNGWEKWAFVLVLFVCACMRLCSVIDQKFECRNSNWFERENKIKHMKTKMCNGPLYVDSFSAFQLLRNYNRLVTPTGLRAHLIQPSLTIHSPLWINQCSHSGPKTGAEPWNKIGNLAWSSKKYKNVSKSENSFSFSSGFGPKSPTFNSGMIFLKCGI